MSPSLYSTELRQVAKLIIKVVRTNSHKVSGCTLGPTGLYAHTQMESVKSGSGLGVPPVYPCTRLFDSLLGQYTSPNECQC